MSTYNKYNEGLENGLGNTSEVFYDEAMKKEAINWAILEIAQMYAINGLANKVTLAVDVDGLADFPDEYMRMIRLREPSIGTKYEYVEPLTMDDMADSESYYWTSDKVVDGDTEQIHIRPKAVASLECRFYKLPTELVNDSDESGLSKHWDKAIVAGGLFRIVANSGAQNESVFFKQEFEDACRKAWGSVRDVGGVKSGNKIKSIYKRKSLLGGFHNV